MGDATSCSCSAAWPTISGRALQRALKVMTSELLQSSSCKGERPRLRIIHEQISGLGPEMLYRQVQFVVEEDDWAQQGEEVEAPSKAEERAT